MRCFEARGQKESYFSKYNSELEKPIQFGWKRHEGENTIVYESLCNRKFKKEDLDLLSQELWSARSMLTMLNFSFDSRITVEGREPDFGRIQSRAFSRANE